MTMLRFVLPIVAATCFGATASRAEAWVTDTFDTGKIIVHSATQGDATGDNYLVVECVEPDRWSIYLESPVEWEDGASYAPDVPATWSVDGNRIEDVGFIFDDRSMTEGIVAYRSGQEDAFERLLATLEGSSGQIELSYFDKRASFSPEGIAPAIRFVRDSCPDQ